MSTNPLKRKADYEPLTPQQACDQANAHVAQIGRAHEIEWVLRNGSPTLQWKHPPKPRSA